MSLHKTTTTMAPRVKNTVTLLLIVGIGYVCYTQFQVFRRQSFDASNDGKQNNFISDFRLGAYKGPIDARSNVCRLARYINAERLKATVVIDVPETGLNVEQLKSTIDGLVAGSQVFIDEVIVVASGLQGPTAAQLDRYLDSLDVTARLIRNAGTGPASSRVAGAELAKSPVVVFADWHVVGTVGWLQPLLGALAAEPRSIVVPHFGDVADPAAFKQTPERLLAEYIWPLTVRLVESLSAERAVHGLYRSPAMRADLFAVRRDFWTELGGYDDALGTDLAAASLELSIRAWQCGSSSGGTRSILMSSCSHIGLRDVRAAIRVVEPSSAKHIAGVWFGSRQPIVLKSVGIASDPNDQPPIGKNNNCRSIETYFNDIAVVPIPSVEATRFGLLQADTDVCARAHEDGRIDMTHCRPTSSESLPSLSFELKSNGRLLTGTGQCLTVQRNSYVLLDSCMTGLSGQQRWRYDEPSGRLINPWSDFCAMHVTDPDEVVTKRMRQILMAQNCTVDLNSGQAHELTAHRFMRWKFTNP